MQSLGFIKMGGDSILAIGRPSSPSIPIPIEKRSLSFGIMASSPSSNSNPISNSSSPSSSSSSSFLSRSQTYAFLKQQMAVTAKLEDYKEAARIRNSLKSFEAEEPVLRLHGLLKKAVEEEWFEDVVRYRDELKIVAPHALLKCSSDATTLEGDFEMKHIDKVG